MRTKFILLLLILIIVMKGNIENYKSLDLLFSQNPISDRLSIFSEDFISSKHQEHSSLSFSPDGKEIFWSRWRLPHDLDKYPQSIKYTKFEKGKWNPIKTAPFSGKWRDGGPTFSPDGNRIYFYSRRPKNSSSEMKNNDIWYIDRVNNKWKEPVNLGNEINTSFTESSPCLSKNGNLYFVSNRNQYDNPVGNNDIFYSEFINGKFTLAKEIGEPINTSYARESFPYIAPDESFLIFSRDDRQFENGKLVSGERKLMISFKHKNGTWRNPVEFGEEFKNARFPSISPDGKYFFCTKYTEGKDENFYWIKFKIDSTNF